MISRFILAFALLLLLCAWVFVCVCVCTKSLCGSVWLNKIHYNYLRLFFCTKIWLYCKCSEHTTLSVWICMYPRACVCVCTTDKPIRTHTRVHVSVNLHCGGLVHPMNVCVLCACVRVKKVGKKDYLNASDFYTFTHAHITESSIDYIMAFVYICVGERVSWALLLVEQKNYLPFL